MATKIKRELRRRSAIEPVIGNPKSEHRMGSLLLRQILAQLTVRPQLIPR